MNKSAQIKALRNGNGNGIQYLLDAAYNIFRNPIAMFGSSYELIAHTDVACDDPLWSELISTGTFSMETQSFFANECFTEDVANANKLVIMKSNELKYDRILGIIYNRDQIKVTYIVMVLCGDLFETEDMVAFEELADKITKEIQDNEFFTAYGKAYHETIINKLLNRVIGEPKVYTPHVQILYDNFKDYLYMAVVGVPQKIVQHNKLAYLKSLLERKYRSFKYAIHSNYIVMIMSSQFKDFYKEQFFDRHDNFFEQNNLFVGVSSSFENLYELRGYYDEALTALKKGIESNCEQRIFVTDGRIPIKQPD